MRVPNSQMQCSNANLTLHIPGCCGAGVGYSALRAHLGHGERNPNHSSIGISSLGIQNAPVRMQPNPETSSNRNHTDACTFSSKSKPNHYLVNPNQQSGRAIILTMLQVVKTLVQHAHDDHGELIMRVAGF